MNKKINLLLLCIFVLIAGCRGYRSEKPPVHINPNLDHQAKFKAQSFTEHPPEGTVPWGPVNPVEQTHPLQKRDYSASNDSAIFTGKDKNGNFVSRIPLRVDEKLMDKGQERFNIYCAVCHDKVGTGKSIVVKRGFVPPPNLSDVRLKQVADGYIFDVITNGVRNMASYKKQTTVEERWAIVAYVRALQNASSVQVSNLNDALRVKIKEQ